MKIDYIIPTIGRDSIEKTKDSINNENIDSNILICSTEKSAGENRNKCLEKIRTEGDWIVFVDDDDYLNKGHSTALDKNKNFDIVVLRMNQQGRVIPNPQINELRKGNVGINFALKTSFYLKYKYLFDNKGHEEDWRFLEQHLNHTKNVKITESIYYMAPNSHHLNSDNADKSAENEAFQMPKKFDKFLDPSNKVDKSINGQKKRLEKQLKDRQFYVSLLEEKEKTLESYVDEPSEENKKKLDIIQSKIDLFNIKIEVIAQKHIFVDTYVYYTEDFMKRYKAGGGKKQSIFKK